MNSLRNKEIRALLTLAGPMIITHLSQMGMSTADAIMAGRVGKLDLAGVSIGSNLFWPILLLISGTLLAVTPTVSQLRGAGRIADTGAVARQAGWIALVGATLGVTIMWNAKFIYELIGVSPDVVPVAVSFLKAQSLGLYGILGFFLFRYLCDGMAWVRPAMVVALTGLCVKVCLNYVLVFGAFGVEPLGGVGCGVASAIVLSYQFIALGLIVRFSRMQRTGMFDRFDLPNLAMLRNIIALGLPIGLSIFSEVAFFSGVGLLIGRLGAEAIAGHQIAMIVGGFMFMIPLAVGQAATIRVGAHVGGGHLTNARRSVRVAMAVAVSIATIAAAILMLGRESIAGLFTTDPSLIEVASVLLIMCGVFQVFDAIQIASMGALRGYKDTRAPMYLTVFSYWLVGMPVGAFLAFGGLGFGGLGVLGFWYGLVIGLFLNSVLLGWRLRLVSGDLAGYLANAEGQAHADAE